MIYGKKYYIKSFLFSTVVSVIFKAFLSFLLFVYEKIYENVGGVGGGWDCWPNYYCIKFLRTYLNNHKSHQIDNYKKKQNSHQPRNSLAKNCGNETFKQSKRYINIFLSVNSKKFA
jgi:hypothetical protein